MADDGEAGWMHPYRGGLSNCTARMAGGWIRVLVRLKKSVLGGKRLGLGRACRGI